MKKLYKVHRGRGWNKEKNMSNNAVKDYKKGFCTWDEFDKSLFTGNELSTFHTFISNIYHRHHFGNNKKEKYMFPENILDIIDSDDLIWTYYKEDYPFDYAEIIEIKNKILKRKSILDKIIDAIAKNNQKELLSCLYLFEATAEDSFTNINDCNTWTKNTLNTFLKNNNFNFRF